MALSAWLAFTGFGLIAAFAGWMALKRHPVRFYSLVEYAVVREVVLATVRQLGLPRRGDSRLRTAMALVAFPANSLPGRFLVSISAADLAMLAPVIDAWIAGQGPIQNLPAEYEDERPRVLQTFKTRMKAEGLWPIAA